MLQYRFLGRVPILIQTKEIEIGKGRASIDVLKRASQQPYLLELSFKERYFNGLLSLYSPAARVNTGSPAKIVNWHSRSLMSSMGAA